MKNRTTRTKAEVVAKADQVALNNPVQSLGSLKIARKWKGSLADPGAMLLGEKPGTLAESESWKLVPDPLEVVLSNGKRGATLGNMWFTKVRAEQPGNVYKVYWTLTFWVTTYGWYTGNDPKCFLELLNAQGGVLAHYEFPVPMDCRHQGKQDHRFQSSEFNPDFYDLIRNTRFTVPGRNWYRCKT